MDVTIHNPDNIPEEIVQSAIAMMEQEEGRRVVEISIRRTGNPDEYGITPVFEKVPFPEDPADHRLPGGHPGSVQQRQAGGSGGPGEAYNQLTANQREPKNKLGPPMPNRRNYTWTN